VERLKIHFLAQQGGVTRIEKRPQLGHDASPPARSARIFHDAPVRAAGDVNIGEHGSYQPAMRRTDAGQVLAGEKAHQRGRLAVELAEEGVRAVRDWLRRGHPPTREVSHQIEIERQFVGLELLEQSEYEATRGGRDEVVGILDSGRYARQIAQRTDGIILEPGVELLVSDGGENRHAVNGK